MTIPAAAGRTDPHQVVVYLLTVTGPDAEQRRSSGSPPGRSSRCSAYACPSPLNWP